MSTTTTAARNPGTRRVLAAMAAQRCAADAAEANLLALAVDLVALHPITDELPAASGDRRLLCADPDTGEILEDDPRLGGEGTPAVAERAVCDLGAALDVSYAAALALVSDAVELCFRLPRLWALVQSGRLQTWKARRVAQHTTSLSFDAVEFVDRHAAVLGVRNRIPHVPALVHEALLQCDPEIALGREEAALEHRGVWFDYRCSDSTATTKMNATLDTLDALDLDATLTGLATSMGRLGDTSPLGVRRAHALGLLAHPQRTLDLFGDSTTSENSRNTASATLYLHITAADLRTDSPSDDDAGGSQGTGQGGGRIERLGAASLDLLRNWLGRLDGVSVRPVLDPTRTDAVDVHDPPGWMREAALLRDGHCVFPGCTIDARSCDLDHIQAYVPLDDGGPPGQTSLENLAALCRRHHRLKTFNGWRYRRLCSDQVGYMWCDPYGTIYRVCPTSHVRRGCVACGEQRFGMAASGSELPPTKSSTRTASTVADFSTADGSGQGP